jgi:hypothetical protein
MGEVPAVKLARKSAQQEPVVMSLLLFCSLQVDANLLAEFVPCPVLLLP